MGYCVGLDVGGTFTDAVVVDDEGNFYLFKSPTTPHNPSEGFLKCLEVAASGFDLDLPGFIGRIEKLTYGTTLVTNMLVEGKAATTGLITTRGFGDTLPIARIGREYFPLDLQFERPAPLISRRMIAEVTERVDYAGEVLVPLRLDEVDEALGRLVGMGAEAVAVCFLWSFKNPRHERAVAERLAARHPGVFISLSTEVAPLMGEYERTATTVMNAGLGPPIYAHILSLVEQLKQSGLQAPLLLMQGTGGLTPAEDVAGRPITIHGSGPAGGVLATRHLSEVLGIPNLIGTDMGGTSFDVSLVTGGEYSVQMVSRVAGHSICYPKIDVHSVGSGGGSIAWLDLGRRIKVGPRSSGADPGPACYGKGGVEPTVTDADLILGYLNPDNFLGGRMALHPDLAEAAISERIAKPMGLPLIEAAAGIRRIVEADSANAIRLMTIQKGYDVRNYTMAAFGGAGGMHAAALARDLGIKTTVVTPYATAQSAFGIVYSDIVHTFTITDVMELSTATPLEAAFQALEEKGRKLLSAEGVPPEAMEIARYADMRYRGQVHQLAVRLPPGPYRDEDVPAILRTFEDRYEEVYGKHSAYKQVGCEIVNLKVDVKGKIRKPQVQEQPEAGADPSAAFKGERPVYFPEAGGWLKASIYVGEKLQHGNQAKGPAVVEYDATTIVILPGQGTRLNAYGDLVIKEAS